jgi:hypothetical protein
VVIPVVGEIDPMPVSVQVTASVLPARVAVNVVAAVPATTVRVAGVTVSDTPGAIVIVTIAVWPAARAVSVAVLAVASAAGGV